jgi:DNA polymerase III delta prime subunit
VGTIEDIKYTTPPTHTLISFATRWGAEFGGINSFNQDLLSAFAAAFYEHTKTICVVLFATNEEQKSALSEQVLLLSLELPETSLFSPELEGLVWEKLKSEKIDLAENLVWLGHDRITGAIAIHAATLRGGVSALIHHMSYSRYESFSESSEMAKRKEEEQINLFENADIAMAVGPLLGDALADMRGDEKSHTLIPGLPDIIVKGAPKNFKGFLSGRLSEDAKRIKQAHLGVAAFGHAIFQSDENSGLPNALKGENEPMLILRGVDFEKSHVKQDHDAEINLKLFSEKYAGRAFNLQALPFTTDRKNLFNDLRGASVAMMPSWHEGFGLVAWEAIAAGVPLILSNKSGAYKLIKSFEDGIYISCITPIDVAGSSIEPYFLQKDVNNLSQALIDIAKDPHAARQKSARLREALISKFTWANCARDVFYILGWQEKISASIDNNDQIAKPSIIPKISKIDLIELPLPRWVLNSGLSDSQLLRAEEAIIPFDAKRAPFLKAQMDWAESEEYPIAVRLLTGAGGVGKTRLALEICRQLQEQNWTTGFLASDCGVAQTEALAEQISKLEQPVCIVIDYAETRQPILLSFLKFLQKSKNLRPVRLLLLARDGGDWWRTLPDKDASCEVLLEGDASSGPFPLPELHDSELERQQAYKIALHTFSSLINIPPPQNMPDLKDSYFSRPLYIQMAALMALRGERPRSAEALQRALVNHEKRYWGKVLATDASDNGDQVRQATLLMTLATISNSVSTERSIEDAWARLGEKKSNLRRLFQTLAPLYPDRQGLQGLRPDLIGEALVAQSLLGQNGTIILEVIFDGPKKLRQTGFTILARLLRNRTDLASIIEDVLTRKFSTCVDDIISVCIETPSPLPQIVERAFKKLPKPQKLQAAGLLAPLLHLDILQLTGLDVLVCQSIALKRKEHAQKKQTPLNILNHAKSLQNLSVALYRDGKANEALKVAEEALAHHKKLKNIKLQEFRSSKANALTNYANRLGDQGRADESIAFAKQALEIYRELDRVHPQKFKPELAMVLNNYGSSLDDYGKSDEAVIIVKEALDIYRNLADNASEEFDADIAMTLNNYANYLDSEGRTRESIAAAQEALHIYEKLAKLKPERYRTGLAMSLNNYATYLSNDEKTDEALSITLIALGIYKELAEVKPERFMADLAMSLGNYGSCLEEQGKFKQALTIAEDSLRIYRNLARQDMKPVQSDLAQSLSNYSTYLASIGDIKNAVIAEQESFDLIKDLAGANPGNHLDQLEQCKLKISLMQWLNLESAENPEINIQLPDTISIRKRRGLEFHKLWLSTWFAPSQSNILYTLYHYTTLDNAQQRMHKEIVFLLVNFAEHLLGKASLPIHWTKISESYLKQKQNNVPIWLLRLASRKGLNLMHQTSLQCVED